MTILVSVLLLLLFVFQVTFAYMKHLWQAGKRQIAFDTLSQFVLTQTMVGSSGMDNCASLTPEMVDNKTEKDKLLARSVSNRSF